MLKVIRSANNPILKPDRTNAWEGQAVFNGCPVRRGRKIFLLYRALSFPHYHTAAGRELAVSDVGIAESSDGVHFKNRRPLVIPEEPWERFGCEDPRVTEFEGNYYIFYTALSESPFGPNGIRVGVAVSPDLKTVTEKHLVTPFNAKAMALFPDRVNGKLCAVVTAHSDLPPARIAIATFDKPEDMWSEAYWKDWEANLDRHAISLLRRPEDQVEVGGPPIRTKDGWLFVYSYIRGYRTGNPLFTVQAALLDLNDPTKVIARTDLPILVPTEEYELYGIAPKIVFPSGILREKKKLLIYYGAADTTCCVASVDLDEVLRFVQETFQDQSGRWQTRFERSPDNPILEPKAEHPWESKAVFNPAAITLGGKVHLLYRAMGDDNTSVIGYAAGVDGFHFDDREPEPIYVPREPFESKRVPNGNSGCEDPRVTLIGDTVYMCYTAYNGEQPPQVALTSIAADDFLAKRWRWKKPVILSPDDIDDKDACLFPEKVNGKYLIFHRVGESIDVAFLPTLDITGKMSLEEGRWLDKRQGFWDSKKVGAAAPPVKTKHGWVMLYHGISERSGVYRVGAILLDKKMPTKIIGRASYPLFEPQMPYELKGLVPNVVFPCGAVVLGDRMFIYYGAADQVVGVATLDMDRLLRTLE